MVLIYVYINVYAMNARNCIDMARTWPFDAKRMCAYDYLHMQIHRYDTHPERHFACRQAVAMGATLVIGNQDDAGHTKHTRSPNRIPVCTGTGSNEYHAYTHTNARTCTHAHAHTHTHTHTQTKQVASSSS
jgi:hypothetical protein